MLRQRSTKSVQRKSVRNTPQQRRTRHLSSHTISHPAPEFHRKARKIVCIGRNYADHVKELNNPMPSSPLLFLKPPSSLISSSQQKPIEIPQGCDELHYEVELGLVIGKNGRNIPHERAMEHLNGYFLALDMTNRTEQNKAKQAGLPWCVAKGYDTFCATSDSIITKDRLPDPSKAQLWLKVNGTIKQDGTTDMMMWNVPHLISYVSSHFTLEDGDLILSGTPKGVGPVVAGDVITAGLVNLETHTILTDITFNIDKYNNNYVVV